MDELLELWAVLAVLALIECFTWVPRSVVGLRRIWGSVRLVTAPEVLGNPGAGLLWSLPLPPFGDLFLVPGWPCALSPEGLVARAPATLDPALRQDGEVVVLAIDELDDLRADGRRVRHAGRVLLDAGSPAAARRLVTRARGLAQAAPEERAVRVRSWIREGLDTHGPCQRLQRFERERWLVDACSPALFLTLFAAAPWLALREGLEASWPRLLGIIGLPWVGVVLGFLRGHRALHPDERGERWQELFGMALLPVAALRARDRLARRLLDGGDPLVLAALFDGRLAAPRLAAARRRLRHPPGDEHAVETWFRKVYEAEVGPVLAALGQDVPGALEAPAPEPDCVAYCPRCHEQFTAADVGCRDCGARALTAFAPSAHQGAGRAG